MATTELHTPFMASVTATTTGQSLLTLMQAVYSSIALRACYVAIQLDTTSGATSLYIGNSTVSSINCGVNLSANQAQQVYAFDSNLIALNDLWLRCSTATVQVNITVVVR